MVSKGFLPTAKSKDLRRGLGEMNSVHQGRDVNEPEIEKILRHTLKDYRLSRGEKRVLSSILDEIGADEHKLGVLRHQAFEIARGELLTPDAKDVLDWLEDVAKVLLPKQEASKPESQVYFSPGDECYRRIVGLLTFARSKVDICVFTITDDSH